MEKISALWQLFKLGNAVADPGAWKRRQITATAVAALLIGLAQAAKAFGYPIPLDPDSASAVAGGVIAAVNVVLTLTTSKTVGVGGAAPSLPPDGTAAPDAGEAGGSTDAGGAD